MNAVDLVGRAFAPAQGACGRTRAAVIGTVVVLLIAATCIRLGLWQLQRLEERRARNALAAERMARPPVDADRLTADSASAAYRRMRLTGSCEGEPIVLAARSRHGAPGVHLLCRFRTTGGRDLLLDRGWVHSADARTVDRSHLAVMPRDTTLEALAIPFPEGSGTMRAGGGERTLQQDDAGVALGEPAPRVIYRMNRAQAVAVTGIELPTWYAQAVGPADRMPVPADPPDLGEGPHFGYAVQWFSFAAIGLIGWILLLARRGDSSRGTVRSAELPVDP